MEWFAEDIHLAGFHAEGSGDRAEQGCLAATRGTDEHHDFSRVGLEVHLFKHMNAIAALAEVFLHGAHIDHDVGICFTHARNTIAGS